MLQTPIADPRLPLAAEYIELLPDRSAVFRRLDQLAFTATSVQCTLTSRGCRPVHDPALLELLAATGQRRRLLVDPRLAMDGQVIDKAARGLLDVRVYGGSLSQMLVFDERCVVVPFDQADPNTGALLIREPLAAPFRARLARSKVGKRSPPGRRGGS